MAYKNPPKKMRFRPGGRAIRWGGRRVSQILMFCTWYGRLQLHGVIARHMKNMAI